LSKAFGRNLIFPTIARERERGKKKERKKERERERERERELRTRQDVENKSLRRAVHFPTMPFSSELFWDA
jgi:hypothetical protein